MSENRNAGSNCPQIQDLWTGPSCRVYIAYSEERDMYYVGETSSPYQRYATHRAVHHRKVIADFPASHSRRERADEERALFQFCEAMGIPLENKHRMEWRSKRRD